MTVEDSIKNIFKNKAINTERLVLYGFCRENSDYIYNKILESIGFILTVKITANGDITTQLIDRFFGEPYTLHLSRDATGSFVGEVRTQYEEILTDIADKCFEPDVFKSDYTR